MSGGASTETARNEALLPTNKAAVGSAHNVELKDMAAQPTPLPIEEDIMQLARLGEIGAIQKLFDAGKVDATYVDDQGITPLHWAAINNHYALCHFLIQAGANLNAKGGDAVATPILWAAKRCHYYIVNLLLQHGADPLLTDDQGFNLLHSATLDGNVFQLVLLLHQDLPVDIPDREGHTSLMWACYKGFPACVDLFLRWGANVSSKDDQGFTALHWALVKGSQACIQKLVEYGSDRFAENNDGKTPAVTAQEMDTERQWHKALSECGYNVDGSPKHFPLANYIKDRKAFLSQLFFFWPFLIIICALYILSTFSVVVAVPLTLIVSWGLQWVVQQALRWAPSDMKTIHKTPFLAGIFAGTLFWVGLRYITRILLWTLDSWSNIFNNAFFMASYGLCTYFYFTTMFEDPGYVPKPGSRQVQKAVIEELMELRLFDENHFCTQCMVRKPLRAKHCKRCNRCVAKTDHHCPWVNNCVAVNNHRHFVLYILTLELGILAFVRLVLAYLSNIATPKNVHCTILADEVCGILMKDPFTIILTLWATLQLTWVTMLTCVQLLQIARALTTWEAMRGHTHTHGTGDTLTAFVTTGSTTAEGGAVSSSGSGPDAANAHRHPKHGMWETWKRLLGLDTFIATALHGSRAAEVQAQAARNPYQRGLVTNCKDFWLDPAPIFGRRHDGTTLLGGEKVDYTALYELPGRMRMRREERDGEETERLVGGSDDAV
ncbi:palmitoyltransferase akr1 [Pseudovirgaria hyperparasitica]|uniref:Palmitoyltransferase n=1 Tax=Pseudovirgaria hyperparasitica TaxID=470096 RepID=A0A6A6WLX3_9PEZI|nr:palmitoyltransferase akr1 [Pseudovirgaria hyperparasitica]KAF2763207.1 palmitoyltransferase akr1 [Pseudovirgaria hyperparasitica]